MKREGIANQNNGKTGPPYNSIISQGEKFQEEYSKKLRVTLKLGKEKKEKTQRETHKTLQCQRRHASQANPGWKTNSYNNYNNVVSRGFKPHQKQCL